ncbi:MAG: 30S ribosomal protein S27ae [Candidatus Micrarchaeia archaeon]|jgi:ribosomal protein S27AE
MAEAKKKARVTKAYKAGRSCPKCGTGYGLAKHDGKGQKARYACGKCGYTEMI